jgi:hypothetical protein
MLDTATITAAITRPAGSAGRSRAAGDAAALMRRAWLDAKDRALLRRIFDAGRYVADNEDRTRLDRLVKEGYLTGTPVNVGDLMYVVTKRGKAARGKE